MKLRLLIFLLALCPALCAPADVYDDYIARYAAIAQQERDASGIPASITLAQGLLESAAGRSTLATVANNHFGIKCGSGWEGRSVLRSDDAPDECFRSYDSAEESYADHTRFLQRRRYQSLFELAPDDYAAWARGLKQCGYATDPKYAERLIAIIERYALYAYDGDSGAEAEATAAFIMQHLQSSHRVARSRGLHYVIAVPGDTYTSIAKEFGIKKPKLLKCNDAQNAPDEIRPWQEVYLEEKSDKAPDGLSSITIGEDESMHSVAQRLGMRLDALRRLNPDAPDRPGSVLKLR